MSDGRNDRATVHERWYEDGSFTKYWLDPKHELAVWFEIYGEDGAIDIDGAVKWDGCMNWQTSPTCMYHFCSPSDADELAQKLREVWDLAEKIMPKALSGVFGT